MVGVVVELVVLEVDVVVEVVLEVEDVVEVVVVVVTSTTGAIEQIIPPEVPDALFHVEPLSVDTSTSETPEVVSVAIPLMV